MDILPSGAMRNTIAGLDPDTVRASTLFLSRVSQLFAVKQSILFGSRARQTHDNQSDADIAVIIKGPHGSRSTVAIDMAGIAFDVMLETGVLVEALPLWDGELECPETFSNPALIEAIARDGVPF